LFKHIDDLSGKLKQSESDLRDKTDLAAFNRDRADKIQNEVKSLKATIVWPLRHYPAPRRTAYRSKNSNAFALVLIDGDCMPVRSPGHPVPSSKHGLADAWLPVYR